MHNVQFYSNKQFNRAAELREVVTDVTNISFVPMYKGDFFVLQGETASVLMQTPMELVSKTDKYYFLGIVDNQEVWCIDLSEIAQETIAKYLPNVVLLSVRDCLHLINEQEASLLAYAKGLINWNNTHQFCNNCGASTVMEEKGHRRKCTNSSCGIPHFPRINPAVIVLIEYQGTNQSPLCLLNMHQKDYGYMCSLFSGFSEIGESLEDTVVREMKEEVNVDVSHINYVASQPWVFPASMMLGFTAKTNSKKFKIDDKEIKKAQWFSAAEITELVQAKKLVVSREDSISHYIIMQWVKQNS
ncbi:NAD(+) diphosphatase [uncultured Kordia sp.]|uniref:NAD(+) diphosphatase n=1 Tax=uncultured Kordia sp. TaxID=507699 RepID=UPI002635F2EC|nr:NAD(+) diphosphatase [uncultured Kordia sp.]